MKHDFKQLSQLAAEVEKAGDLSYAAELWRKSASLAQNPQNQDYCLNRMAFCLHWKGVENGR
ncbi:ANR family transcriptional regulator [Volucribacter amazonae]|uniref:ANR family transcriptional regulator n=1 Tax=Volucribacter amazonae TaxID=256731 RepID=A0A9X4PB65_9PAST|nr:ANR family transcriptional regulator [Volucribacter amazonae]MDG6894444.1 hypothetical protein [Volucribacter amazonae]